MPKLRDIRPVMKMARALGILEYEFGVHGGTDFGKTFCLLEDNESGEEVQKIARVLVDLEKRLSGR